MLILYLVWLLTATYTLHYPEFSILELNHIPNFLISALPLDQLWLTRFLSIISVFILIYIINNKYSKNNIIGSVMLLTTPWLYITAREFNVYTVLFLLTALSALIENRKLMIALVSISLYVLIGHSQQFSKTFLIDKVVGLKYMFDGTLLFFQMEKVPYLKIPHTGYFSFTSIPLLILGIMYFRVSRKLIYLFFISIIFYFLSPNSHFLLSGVGFLVIWTIIMVTGSKFIKNKYIKVLIIGMSLVQGIYFLDLYFNHYQYKVGNARNHAEISLIKFMQKNYKTNFIISHNEILNQIVSKDSFKLIHRRVLFIRSNDMKSYTTKCVSNDRTQCVLTKEEYYLLPDIIQSKTLKITDQFLGTIYYLL